MTKSKSFSRGEVLFKVRTRSRRMFRRKWLVCGLSLCRGGLKELQHAIPYAGLLITLHLLAPVLQFLTWSCRSHR